MTTLKIGIADDEERKARTLRIAGGEESPHPDEPEVWFTSTESFAKVLSAGNRVLLHVIAEQAPQSVAELSDITGRARPNLSRTLKMMVGYGLIRMERSGRKLAPKLIHDRVALDLPLTVSGGARALTPAMLKLSSRRKLDLCWQSTASECSLACLVMIAGYHHHPVTLPELRHRYPISPKGISFKKIVAIADDLGFASRPLGLEMEEIGQLKTPAILRWDGTHLVVLSRVTSRLVVEVFDPAKGVQRLSLGETTKHFSGIALELTPRNLSA